MTFIICNPSVKVDDSFSNRDRFDIFITEVLISVPVVPSNLKDEQTNNEKV